jgi:hypothetical protein
VNPPVTSLRFLARAVQEILVLQIFPQITARPHALLLIDWLLPSSASPILPLLTVLSTHLSLFLSLPHQLYMRLGGRLSHSTGTSVAFLTTPAPCDDLSISLWLRVYCHRAELCSGPNHAVSLLSPRHHHPSVDPHWLIISCLFQPSGGRRKSLLSVRQLPSSIGSTQVRPVQTA